jgi:hypothetical protein
MNDMVSMRKMRFGVEDGAGWTLLDAGAGDFVGGGKAVV